MQTNFGHVGCVSSTYDFISFFDLYYSDISGWDVSNSIDFGIMFANATVFNQGTCHLELLFTKKNFAKYQELVSTYHVRTNVIHNNCNEDLSNWNVESATSFTGMFSNATRFDSDLTKWNVSRVESFLRMFEHTQRFTGSGLETWDTRSSTDLRQMFYHAKAFNGDLSSWDVSDIEGAVLTFAFAEKFTADLSSWDVSKIRDFSGEFFFLQREHACRCK